ncbi:hypothetical protein IHE44_0013919 [Lamprotornis superbus]|uniref:Uncharacterized protein n=1 Tax=Lamprotornis superbus TaxID=245042 RepID=A0A835U2R3_9PASS|nr:hypothetical protein IHE44_0013919 [Lamprotornis superbus]
MFNFFDQKNTASVDENRTGDVLKTCKSLFQKRAVDLDSTMEKDYQSSGAASLCFGQKKIMWDHIHSRTAFVFVQNLARREIKLDLNAECMHSNRSRAIQHMDAKCPFTAPMEPSTPRAMRQGGPYCLL